MVGRTNIIPLLCAVVAVAGHGAMLLPHSWSDAGGKIGVKTGWQDILGNELVPSGIGPGSTNVLSWFNNNTMISIPPTLDPSLRTWHDVNQSVLQAMREVWTPTGPTSCLWHANLISGGFLNKPLPTEGDVDLTMRMPWRAPGWAPVQSPCGIAGGNSHGFKELQGELGTESARIVDMEGGFMQATADGGYGWGADARTYRFPGVVETEWKRGSVVEAAWGIFANHGGGYSYRLCKLPAEGKAALTEECFQQTPLDFAGDTQWAQWGEDETTRVAFQANRTREGTWPKGSQWTKNPVPVCKDPTGGEMSGACPSCSHAGGFQFPPPAPGVHGYGLCPVRKKDYRMAFSIFDLLQVPSNLTEGQYVLSFRWDVEQTPQSWATCANIKVV